MQLATSMPKPDASDNVPFPDPADEYETKIRRPRRACSFTTKRLDELEAESTQYRFWDEVERGLFVFVYPLTAQHRAQDTDAIHS